MSDKLIIELGDGIFDILIKEGDKPLGVIQDLVICGSSEGGLVTKIATIIDPSDLSGDLQASAQASVDAFKRHGFIVRLIGLKVDQPKEQEKLDGTEQGTA